MVEGVLRLSAASMQAEGSTNNVRVRRNSLVDLCVIVVIGVYLTGSGIVHGPDVECERCQLLA